MHKEFVLLFLLKSVGEILLLRFWITVESYLFEGPMFVVIKIGWFRGGVILWVSGLRDYNARHFTTLFNVHGYVFVGKGDLQNPRMSIPHKQQ